MRGIRWVCAAALVGLPGIAMPQEPAPHVITTLPLGDHVADPATGTPLTLSADGRYAAFVSDAKLVEADTNGLTDIYVLDTVTGTVTLETWTAAGEASNGGSDQPSLDGSGRYVVFASAATNLVDPPLAPGGMRVFLRDRLEGTTRVLSVDPDGRPTNGWSDSPVISLDGTTVAFRSSATTLVAGDDRHGRRPDVYLLRLASGLSEGVSVTSAGEQLASGMSFAPSLSGDGRFVAFTSSADLTCPRGEACARSSPVGAGRNDVYVHDTQTGHTRRVSRATNRGEPNGASFHPAISADGRLVAFASDASNLVARDRNRATDVFVADLKDGSIELVSRTPRGRPDNGTSNRPVISGDGSLVAFQSEAADLICESGCAPHERDINMVWDVFLHDRRRGTTVRVSADEGPEWMDPSGNPALAAFAPVVAFNSQHPIDGSAMAGGTNSYLVKLPAIELTHTSSSIVDRR
jgi:Tol biopolymer transport system component